MLYCQLFSIEMKIPCVDVKWETEMCVIESGVIVSAVYYLALVCR